VNRILDDSPLEPLTDAADLLTHDWVVLQVDDLDALRQVVLTNRALAIAERKRSPRAALKRVDDVYRTLQALEKENRMPLIATLIDSEKQTFAMLLSALKEESGDR
ncbi:MAG: hypothetical protein PVG88_05985, partial [Methyloceanibacter sp.]|jgi:hypothetical protein